MGPVIPVPRQELEQLRSEAKAFVRAIDEVVRHRHAIEADVVVKVLKSIAERRVDANMLLLHLEDLLKIEEAPKTPTRPPSTDAAKAYESSASFKAVKDPRRDP